MINFALIFGAGVIWFVITLILGAILLGFIFQAVITSYIISEAQTWTRVLAILAATLLAVKKNNSLLPHPLPLNAGFKEFRMLACFKLSI